MIDDGEALRRRLYRPGADDLDVAAYVAARTDVAEREPAGPSPASPPRGPRRWWLPVGAAAVVLAAAAAVLPQLALGRAGGPAPLPTRAVDAARGDAFVTALSQGRDAGLGPWWEAGAPYLEEHGTGDGTVELPVSASARGGRLTVLLVVAEDAVAGWTAARLVIHDDRTIHLQQQAGAVGRVRAGVPAIGRLAYSAAHRPLRLLVRAPAGVRWGVAAVFDR